MGVLRGWSGWRYKQDQDRRIKIFFGMRTDWLRQRMATVDVMEVQQPTLLSLLYKRWYCYKYNLPFIPPLKYANDYHYYGLLSFHGFNLTLNSNKGINSIWCENLSPIWYELILTYMCCFITQMITTPVTIDGHDSWVCSS